MDDRLWMLLGAGAYAVAMGITLWRVFARHRGPLRTVTLPLLLLGFGLQTVGLHLRGLENQSCPIGNPFEVLQFVGWSTMVVYLLTGTVFRMSLLGSFCASLAMILSVASFLIPGGDVTHATGLFGGNPWVEVHASLALFSYGVFGLLAVTSTMYLLQHYGLKQKYFEGLFRFLPPIVQLDLVNGRLVRIGAAVFTISVLIGSVYWIDHLDSVSGGKLGSTVGLWLGYLTLTLARWRGWIHGQRFAWFGIALFVLALLVLWPVEVNRASSPVAVHTIAP